MMPWPKEATIAGQRVLKIQRIKRKKQLADMTVTPKAHNTPNGSPHPSAYIPTEQHVGEYQFVDSDITDVLDRIDRDGYIVADPLTRHQQPFPYVAVLERATERAVKRAPWRVLREATEYVARGLIPNSDREYKKLGSVINDARLAGMVDWHHITDRTRFLRAVSSWESPAQIIRGAANGYTIDVWKEQDVRFEVWIEKDALVGVVERACENLRVPFLSCRGYTSQSEMWTAAQRHLTHIEGGKRVIVLHLGDHDPSGLDMTRDITDRISMFLNYEGVDVYDPGDPTCAWQLRRLALNWDQVQEYTPPPNPAKLTDSRGAAYVDEYGNESWELDALEPTVIGKLITDAVYYERDENLWADAMQHEATERAGLVKAAERWADVVSFLDGGAA